MNITCGKSILNNAISPALLAVTNKNTIPALEGLLITADKDSGSVTVCGYDLEKGVKVFIGDENVSVTESGNIIINAVKFSSIIRNLPEGDINISTDENFVVSITSNKSEFNLHAIDGESYPVLPVLKGDKNFKMKQGVLKNLINGTLFSVATNNPKPVLNGVFFEITDKIIKAVSVDGNRLSYRFLENEVYIKGELAYDGSILQKFIVPGKTLSELYKLLKDTEDFVEIEMTNKHLIVMIDNIVFFSRLIEGEYIPYTKSVAQNCTLTCVVNKKEFMESVERASILMDEKNKSGIKLSFEKNSDGYASLKITSITTIGKVYDEFEIEMEGEDLQIGFSHSYLIDALKHIEDEKITLKLEHALRPMILIPTSEKEKEDLSNKYLYLVLPYRLRD